MKALIISAGDSKNPEKLKEYAKNADFIICADGGYRYAFDNNITPDVIVGDFDSLECTVAENKKIEVIRLKPEKDETDTLFAFRCALKKGCDDITVYGALGGERMEHTYANICLLAEALEKNVKAVITDGNKKCLMTDDKLCLNGEKGSYISVFSFSDASYNVILKGLKYELNGYTMKNSDSIGVSNEFTEKTAEISVGDGKLLIICN